MVEQIVLFAIQRGRRSLRCQHVIERRRHAIDIGPWPLPVQLASQVLFVGRVALGEDQHAAGMAAGHLPGRAEIEQN